MRELDDPANPYREQYAEWDRFMVAHAHEPTDEERAAYFDGKLPETWRWDSVAITHEGFCVPHAISIEKTRNFNANGHKSDGACSQYFQVFADMPADLQQRLDEFDTSVYARFVMPIPAWLAANPPLVARIWPDGSVTTHGALGSWNGEGDVIFQGADGWSYTSDPYYLYDSAGRLIKQTPKNGEEMDLFLGNYRALDPLDTLFFSGWYEKMLSRGYSRGWRGLYLHYDYLFWYGRDSREMIEIYDIDGTCYGPGFDIMARNDDKFGTIGGDWLVKLYAAQQAQLP